MEHEEDGIYEQNPYEEIHLRMDLFIQQTPFYPIAYRDPEYVHQDYAEWMSETESVDAPPDPDENNIIDLTDETDGEADFEEVQLYDQYGNPVIVIDE